MEERACPRSRARRALILTFVYYSRYLVTKSGVFHLYDTLTGTVICQNRICDVRHVFRPAHTVRDTLR